MSSCRTSLGLTVRPDGKRTALDETHWFDNDADGNVDAGDGDGNVQSDEIKSTSYTWTYDSVGRLTDEVLNHWDDTHDQTENFTYDLTGNRSQLKRDRGNDGNSNDPNSDFDHVITYDYDANDRLIEELLDDKTASDDDTTTTYIYDATQQTSKSVTSGLGFQPVSSQFFAYNLQGRMASVTNDSFTSGVFTGRERTRYEYDSKSYRVNLTNEDDVVINEVAQDTWTETSTIEFLADHHNHTGYTQTIRETTTNPDGTTKAIDYTFGHDEIAQRVVERSDPNTITSDATHVFGHDGHGSVRVIYDLATTAVSIAQVFAFAAYGEMIALHGSAANSLSPSSRLSSLGYSGEHFDAKAQQQYLRARFYDPANGRFNRLDPFAGNMQDPLSLHKYAFVHGDPVQGVDPTGEFTMVSSLGGMSIGNAISNPSNDASLSAYSAAIAASSAQSGGEFVQVFNEQFQEALQGSLLSSIPLFGSLYDLYKLGESAFSLIGPTLDLTGEISGGSFGVASGISAAFGLPAVPLRGVRGGLRGWTASRFFTKFRGASTTPWTSVKRTVNGQVDWIPMIGTAQDTSGNHSSIVAGLAKNLAKKADTELVAMNRSLDTVLRTVGGTYPAWARKLGVKIYVPIRFGDSAKTLGAYQPDVVAIQGSTVTIREVASGSQVTSGGAVRQGYLDYLTSVKKEAERLGRRSQLDFRIEVWDSSGNFVREI